MGGIYSLAPPLPPLSHATPLMIHRHTMLASTSPGQAITATRKHHIATIDLPRPPCRIRKPPHLRLSYLQLHLCPSHLLLPPFRLPLTSTSMYNSAAWLFDKPVYNIASCPARGHPAHDLFG
jgi:hypothetical protein